MKPFMPPVPADHPPFVSLPVRYVSRHTGGHKLAVHLSGRFALDRPPLICLAGFHRNMTDYADFLRYYREEASPDWPVLLVDLAGRGRSSQLGSPSAYSSLSDAHDLVSVTRALGISRALFMGQGHGGQVVMALAAMHPGLIEGAVLIDAAPTPNTAAIVRLRSNLQQISSTRRQFHAQMIMRQMLSVDYPGRDEETLDMLAARTHYYDAKGQIRGLFDPALVRFLDQFGLDDEFVPQWPLFDGLSGKPLMLARTQTTDQLSVDMFHAMSDRRPDVIAERFAGSGSPALLNDDAEAGLVIDFISHILRNRR
jgi:pimeloyl-ACP methyl ester carboxylesterase